MSRPASTSASASVCAWAKSRRSSTRATAGFRLTVYFGQRKGSASTADLDPQSIEQTVEQACAIARYTEEDPATGLADPALLARDIPDLDLWHPWEISPQEAIAPRRRNRGRRPRGRSAHRQFRRRLGAGQRRRCPPTPTRWASSAPSAAPTIRCRRADRRGRRRHAARLLVRQRARGRRFHGRRRTSAARPPSARLRGLARAACRRAIVRCCSCPRSRAA